jgi:hypothetical protein
MNNTQDLLNHHEDLCKLARDLMAVKNHDYAGSKGDTPWMNFQRSEEMGICSTEQAFLVRITDKISRLITFANNGVLLVKDEGVEDSIIDLINYLVLLSAFLNNKKSKQEAAAEIGSICGVHSTEDMVYNGDISNPNQLELFENDAPVLH